MLLRPTTTTEVDSFAHPRLDVLPRPLRSVRARGRRSRAGPADEPVSMLPLQTLRGVDMETRLCALPTCSAEEERMEERKEISKEERKVEKNFILFICTCLFFPFRRLRRYIVFSRFCFGTARRRLRWAGYSLLSIKGIQRYSHARSVRAR
jgi:hypothetical protein